MDLSSALKDSIVSFATNQGEELRGELRHLTRYEAVFDLYNLSLSTVIQASEALTEFKIYVQDKVVYQGRAVIKQLINTDLNVTCDVTLEDSWIDLDLLSLPPAEGIKDQYRSFFSEWQKNYRIEPDYKIVVADIQTYLMDLRIWLEQLALTTAPEALRETREEELLRQLEPACLGDLDILFDKFEAVADRIDAERQSFHRNYMKRQLHPFVLCAPFANRTFFKPLGYAGDYEMVDMIGRDQFEGGSLFAKIINRWFLKQAPAVAHRNRIEYLVRRLIDESARCASEKRAARILNLGCGPAIEIQKFIEDSVLSERTEMTLLDFNQDTISHVTRLLNEVTRRAERKPKIEIQKRSVQQILRKSGKDDALNESYDFIYCAGLFDYLSDPVCQRLLQVFYSWIAPGGLVLLTNVDNSNPRRHTMESILEWNLIYRNTSHSRKLIPKTVPQDAVTIQSELSGVNIIMEIRKQGAAHG